jgi:hypothetical protein
VRRLIRILLNLAAVGSLVVGVAAVGLWVRSYRYHDEYNAGRYEPDALVFVASERGGLRVGKVDHVYDALAVLGAFQTPPFRSTRLNVEGRAGAPQGYDWPVLAGPHVEQDVRMLGFRLVHGQWHTNAPFWGLRIPYWSVVLLSLPLPAWCLLRWRRRRRRAALGHCPACGYDLRATPHRCPECGRESAGSRPPRRRPAG